MEYGDAQRAFLQILLQRRILSAKEVTCTYGKICEQYNVEANKLREFVLSINDKLEDLHMAVRKSVQEEDEKDVHCFVLINNLNNDFTRACSSFTKVELAYFKKLVETLVLTEDGYLTETAALNLASERQSKLSASVAENLIDRLVEEKWLLRSKGKISLGALTVSELQTYLEEHFADSCVKCYFCKNYTFKGYRCPKCELRGHRNCLKNYWIRIGKEPCCPDEACNEQWEDVTEMLSSKRNRADSE